MLVNKDLIEENNLILGQKIVLFKKAFPELNFDKHGRAKIGQVKGADLDIYEKLMTNISNSEKPTEHIRYFNSCLYKYCVENDYRAIKTNLGYVEIDNLIEEDRLSKFTLSQFDINENYLHFIKTEDVYVRVKFTRVLSQAYANFEKDYPEYKEVKEKLKTARASSDAIKIAVYKETKKIIEEGVILFEYDKVLNAASDKEQDLYITVNPLDILTSSGVENGDGLTTFRSCYATRLWEEEEGITIDYCGEYSEPMDLCQLGQFKNRAIIYIKNSRSMAVKETDFEFIGYKYRLNCWLNEDKIFLEKLYPSQNIIENIEECLSINNILQYKNETGMPEKFKDSMQDTELGKDIDNSEVYLDKVGFNRLGELCMLPVIRSDGSYHDYTGIGSDSTVECHNCDRIIHGSEALESDYYDHWYCQDCYYELHYACKNCCDELAHEESQYVEIDGEKYCPHCASVINSANLKGAMI